jgi:hypothetical protein
VTRPDGLERTDDDDHRFVPALGDKGLVEASGIVVPVSYIVEPGLLRFDHCTQFRHNLGETIGARSANARTDRLKVEQGSAHISKRRATGLQHHADHLRRPFGRRQMHDGPPDIPAPYRNKALRLEDPHGLPDGRKAHPEFLEQVFLSRQKVAFFEPPAEYVIPQAGRDNLRNARLA